MTQIPETYNERPWSKAEAATLMYVPTVAEGEAPVPADERPWYRKQRCVVIFDKHGQPVSGVKNAEFLFHVEQCFDPLKDALYQLLADFDLAATLAGFSDDALCNAKANAIAALRKAGVKL